MASDADGGRTDQQPDRPTLSSRLDRYTDRAQRSADRALSRMTPERRLLVARIVKACFAVLLTAMIAYFAASYYYGIELFEF